MNEDAAMEGRDFPGPLTERARGIERLLLRPEEGAEALGLSRARLYELMADGELKSIKVGRCRRIPLAELESWVARKLAE